MKKIKLPYSKELSDYFNDELENNYELTDDGYLEISYHDDEDLFNIGKNYGRWLNSSDYANYFLP